MKTKTLIFFIIIIISHQIYSQSKSNIVYVDDAGKMRWTANKEEANFWGVNYTVPFAFSYRAIKSQGFSHEKVIDQDIEQFKRLGLNAYRIHVWDREVSDRDGNLIENEHLRLMDYLIHKLIQNNIYIILTPIAWWGNGYPEPDFPTEGFSSHGSKLDLSTKSEFIKAEKNYLEQFVNHKNIYTGKSYKDEAKIIAFEIINEPNLPPDSNVVTDYVNQMVNVLHSNGVTKPIFFNISQNPGKEQWIGVANSNIEGISFQWYPTGLVNGNTLGGNYLPHVSQYPLPDYSPKINSKAKMVYEFDAPDIATSTMYPLMASSFKNAGMQWATMFSYDPTPIATYNSEYSTHYLNLVYTPGKAIGYLIASNLFLDKEKSIIDIYSQKNSDYRYKVSYQENLSILNSDKKFIYSNSTKDQPRNFEKLEHVAGVGISEIVNYEGTGAYFLDKIEDGKWKLEVFPDAVWIKDPFGNNNLEESVARLIWSLRKIKIKLPKLVDDYFVYQNGKSAKFIGNASQYEYNILPGSYIISNTELSNKVKLNVTSFNFHELKKFTNHHHNFIDLKNNSRKEIHEGDSLIINADIYSDLNNLNVSVYARKIGWRGYSEIKMVKYNIYKYHAKVSKEFLTNGILEYFITVKKDSNTVTFPGNYSVDPNNWGFNSDNSFKVLIKPKEDSKILFSPLENEKNIIIPNVWFSLKFRKSIQFLDSKTYSYVINLNEYSRKINELAVQIYVGDEVRKFGKNKIKQLLLDVNLISEVIDSVELRFIYSNNLGFIRKVSKHDFARELLINTSSLEPIKYALIPRPYPTFLPYWYKSDNLLDSDIFGNEQCLEFIQIAIPLDNVKANSDINSILKTNEIRAIYN